MIRRGAASDDIAWSCTYGPVDLVAANLDLTPDSLHRMSLWLSEDERQRAGRFAFERGWRRFVAARGRLRELLAERLSVHPESIAFSYGKRGKPALAAPLRKCLDALVVAVAYYRQSLASLPVTDEGLMTGSR